MKKQVVINKEKLTRESHLYQKADSPHRHALNNGKRVIESHNGFLRITFKGSKK